MTNGGSKAVLRLNGTAVNGMPGPARYQQEFRA